MPSNDRRPPRAASQTEERSDEHGHVPSSTAVAGEALRSGVVPPDVQPPPLEELPVLDPDIRAGDPDVDVLSASHVGGEAPGGHMPTPDQDRVDDIVRACGVAEEDSGALRTSSELLDRRDARRAMQEVPEPNPLVD